MGAATTKSSKSLDHINPWFWGSRIYSNHQWKVFRMFDLNIVINQYKSPFYLGITIDLLNAQWQPPDVSLVSPSNLGATFESRPAPPWGGRSGLQAGLHVPPSTAGKGHGGMSPGQKSSDFSMENWKNCRKHWKPEWFLSKIWALQKLPGKKQIDSLRCNIWLNKWQANGRFRFNLGRVNFSLLEFVYPW